MKGQDRAASPLSARLISLPFSIRVFIGNRRILGTYTADPHSASASGLFFSSLVRESAEAGGLVGLRGLTWNQVLPLLREIRSLQRAA